MTLTLSDFLLARFAEDVEDACKMAGLHPDGTEDWKEDTDGYAVSNRMTRVGRRVLADCEAKRRIIEIHYNGDPESWPERCSPCDTQAEPCATLLALALPYADHPDYRPEWKPTA